MRILRTLTIVGLFVVTGLAASCAATRPPSKLEVKVKASFFSSNTGLRVFVVPVEQSRLVRLDVRYSVGATADPPGKNGLAHLVEHLLFENTITDNGKTVASELSRLTRSYNASTTLDSTHYKMLVDPEHLNEVLGLHVRSVVAGCKGFDDATFSREREIVRNEIRSDHATAEGQIPKLLYETLYPEGHPYHRTVGGDDVQITRLTKQDVCDFIAQHYVASNATFVFAGRVTEPEARTMAGQWLARFPAGASAGSVRPQPVSGQRREVAHKIDIEKPLLTVAWPMPPLYSPDGRLARFAVNGVTSRVAEFAWTYKFGYDVQGEIVGGAYAPFYLLSVTLHGASKRKEALDMIWKAARDAPRLAVPQFAAEVLAEYLRVHASESALLGYESIGERAEFIADHAQFEPDGGYLIGQLREAGSFSTDHVRALAGKLMNPSRATVVTFQPEANASGAAVAQLRYGGTLHGSAWKVSVDPAEADVAAPVPTVTTQQKAIREFTLDNGLKVVLWGDADLPLVHSRLVVASGLAHEPANRPGIAEVASGGDAELDSTVFGDITLSSEYDSSLEYLADEVRNPGYGDMDDLRSAMRKRLALERGAKRRAFIGDMETAVYGETHPYARTHRLSPSSLGGITRDNAYAFAHRHFVARNATLLVSGQFDLKLMEHYVRDSFEPWKAGTPAPKVTAPAHSRAQLVKGVNDQSAVTEVFLWFAGDLGVGDDYAARLVLASMLEGRFKALREDAAITYGFSADYDVHEGPGLWRIEGHLDAQRTREGLAAIQALLERLRTGDIRASFALARRQVLKQLLSGDEDAYSYANRLEFLARHDLPLDFYDKLAAQVAHLTPADVQTLLSVELGPAKQVTGLFGPQSQLPEGNQLP